MSIDEFESKLKELKLSKKDFSKLSGLSYSGVVNWNSKEAMPVWVEPFLKYYLKSMVLDNFIESIKQFKTD